MQPLEQILQIRGMKFHQNSWESWEAGMVAEVAAVREAAVAESKRLTHRYNRSCKHCLQSVTACRVQSS